MGKVVLITGASSGMGREAGILLAQSGYTVYGAARRLEKLNELKPLGIHTIAVDVTDDAAMVQCVAQVMADEGRIDVLVNNAGFGSYGAIEDVPMDEARYQLDVNLFGAARLIQLVLPHMRDAGSGRIINISSIGGKLASPLGGWYHASKFALEGLSDSLRNEVKQFGIDVVLIEPGLIKSEWGHIALDNLLKTSGNSAYKVMVQQFAATFKGAEQKNAGPAVIAALIKKAIEAKRPRTRYVAGYMAKPAILARKLLSDRIIDRVIMSQIK